MVEYERDSTSFRADEILNITFVNSHPKKKISSVGLLYFTYVKFINTYPLTHAVLGN